MQVRDQIHAPANLSPVPIGKVQGRVSRSNEKVNLSHTTEKFQSIILLPKDKNKIAVQGRVNDLLLHMLKELGLKFAQKSIGFERTSVDFLRPTRQMFG